MQNKYGAKVLIHRTESENLRNPEITLNYYIGIPDIKLEEDSRIDDGDLIHIGEIELSSSKFCTSIVISVITILSLFALLFTATNFVFTS